MAFANLFTRLSAVEDEVKTAAQTASAHRNGSDNGKRGNSRKRKPQGEQAGPFKKKQCFQARMDSYNATSFKYNDHHMQNTDRVHASSGFTKEVIHNQSNKASYKKTYYHGQNYTAKNNNHNVNKQQQQTKKMERLKNQHQMKNRWTRTNQTGQTRKGGGNRKHEDGKRALLMPPVKSDSQSSSAGIFSSKESCPSNISENLKFFCLITKDARVKPTGFMTQDFKDQNALIVDGQLLCRHFLWGRCIKGDECQLKHIQGYNDLIKEVCKFYIQGFCTKGESCPYMHKSFPCKFFHRKAKCSQGADCRFSHEPLNAVTNQLLDEALKRESDFYELAKKAEQESSGHQATTDESEITDANRTLDVLIQPVRPNFYNSEGTTAEQEALCQAEEQSNDLKEAVPPQTPPHSPLSVESNNQKLVCYSVEAVLGRPLFKPFPSFFTTPQSQESTSLSLEKSSECTPDSANQSEVPYSVDVVLRSCKSAESSTFSHTPTHPAAQTVSYDPQTVSYNPKTDCVEINDHLLSSDTQNEKVLCPASTRTEATKSQGKMFKSLSSLKTCPDSTLESRDLKKRGEIPESLMPAQRISHEVKLELLNSPTVVPEKSFKSKGDVKTSSHLPTDITCSVNCKNERCNCKTLTCSKHPTQLKPHFSGVTSNPEASVKTPCPPGFSEFKRKAALSAGPVMCSAKTPDSVNLKQLLEIPQHSKETESGLRPGTQQQSSNETTAADCSSKMANCDLSVECDETPKRLIKSLFTSLITDSPKPTLNSVTTPASYQSSYPTGPSAHCTNNDKRVKTAVEPCKASTRSFFNLFASPLSAASLPYIQPDYLRTTSCSQESDKSIINTSNLSNSKKRASELETSLPCQIKSDDKQTSHWSSSSKLSTSPKNEDSLSETVKQPKKQQVFPACSLVSDSLSKFSSSAPCGNRPDRFTTQSQQQQQPIMLTHKTCAAATEPTNSVLKTLFLCLSPYQQDGHQQDRIQISVPSEGGDDKSSMGSVVKEKRKSKKKDRRKKQLETQDSHKQSHEKTAVHSTEHQKSFQNTQFSLEATGGSTLCSPTMTEPQLRNFGAHNSPFKAVMPPMQHHMQPGLKHSAAEGKWANGNVAVTPLKDLFKSLDTTVFHFGQ